MEVAGSRVGFTRDSLNGRINVPDTPGFGVELNPDVQLIRPVAR